MTHDIWCGKLICLSRVFTSAACREDVSHPLGFTTAGERNEESFLRSKDVYWCTVDLAEFSSDVGQDAEAENSPVIRS